LVKNIASSVRNPMKRMKSKKLPVATNRGNSRVRRPRKSLDAFCRKNRSQVKVKGTPAIKSSATQPISAFMLIITAQNAISVLSLLAFRLRNGVLGYWESGKSHIPRRGLHKT
jgi:hypothetical protein